MRAQQFYNPAFYHFRWTDNWYEWDREAAHKAALKARNDEAKKLKAQGHTVRKYTFKNQLITRGGIGTPHPEISMFVTCYVLEVCRS